MQLVKEKIKINWETCWQVKKNYGGGFIVFVVGLSIWRGPVGGGVGSARGDFDELPLGYE